MLKRSINKATHGISIVSEAFAFALRTVWQATPLLLIFTTFTTILNGLAPMAVIWVGKQVLDSIVNAVKAEWNSAEVTAVYYWLGLQLLVFVVAALIQRSNSFLIRIMGKRLSLDMSRNVLVKASSLDLTTFEDSEFYDKITRARTESRGTPLRLVQRFQGIISETFTFISMGALIASLSTALVVVMISVCVPLLAVLVIYSEKQYHLQYTRTEESRKARYLSSIMTTRHFVREVINLGLWSYLIQKWLGFSLKFYHQDVWLIKRQNLAELGANTVMVATEVGATGYIFFLGIRVISLSVGEIIMYSRAFAQGLQSLRQGVEGISGIYEDILFLSNLIEFHKLKPHIRVKKKTLPSPKDIESIELQNVSFRYPGTQHNVMKNVTVTFRKSESTLIVGTNGAGKTTLVKLMLRLYDPDEGRILFNGIDIREFEVQSLQRIIGVIFQDYVRFAVSAKENIGYGLINELQNQNRIRTAARLAQADALINALPHKYDTILSRLFQNGQELSTGQWQRICLARLFMKNSPILIFDEPTASLDIDTEVNLLHEINQLSKNKVCILISHRMFRPNIAEQIIVLKKGEIVETGTYEDLIRNNGEFARFRGLYHNMTKEYSANDINISVTAPVKLS